METRVAVIGIIVENTESAEKSIPYFMNMHNIFLVVWECRIRKEGFLLSVLS